MTNMQTALARAWERVIAVRAHDEEEARLGRLFNTLMLISTGIVIALSAIFLLMQPLGLIDAKVSWIAAAFPLAFIPLSLFCLAESRRGHVRSMVLLYAWVNLIAIGIAAWLFDGVSSPAWPLFIWTITVAGTLLAPAYALWLTGSVVLYFAVLLLATRWGLYSPPLSFGPGGREFVHMSALLIILVSTVGLLTWLNMRSLHEALEKLRGEIAMRKQTEEQLRLSEARYRSVVNNAGDLIFTLSGEGIYLSLNPAFEKISGWPVQEWIGKSFSPLVPPTELPRAFDVLQKTLREEAVGVFELPVRKKSGDYFTGEFTVAPLREGDSIILLGICRDVSERKRIEEALIESERKFRAIFDTAPEGIFTTDLEGRFTSLNPAALKMVGWAQDDLLGAYYMEYIHPDDLERINAVFLSVISGKPGGVDTRVRFKSGEYGVMDITAAPWIEHGKTVGSIGFFRDITERRRMEEEIRKLNEELELKVQLRTQQLLQAQENLVRKEKLAVLGQVAGSVGHELRNPLGVMSNAVYFLQTVLGDANESVREYLDIIKNEIIGSERIVSDLLDSVRTKPPQPETVEVAHLMEQTLRKCVVPSSVTVRLDIPDFLPPVMVDPLQIHQVFRNLISNAIDAMPDGGTLEIRMAEDRVKGNVTVSVRDTGVGMTPEQLDKLFQPLFTTKARGIGLGLVVVKNLTEANGGKVEVQSAAGKGSEFRVVFPATREGEAT